MYTPPVLIPRPWLKWLKYNLVQILDVINLVPNPAVLAKPQFIAV